MKVGIFDAETNRLRIQDIKDDLEEFYGIIKCNTIDIVTRYIKGVRFDIICDDEGLFKENPVVTAYDIAGRPMLVGMLIFAHHDDEGNMTGITTEDEKLLKVATYFDVVWPCDYFPPQEVQEV